MIILVVLGPIERCDYTGTDESVAALLGERCPDADEEEEEDEDDDDGAVIGPAMPPASEQVQAATGTTGEQLGRGGSFRTCVRNALVFTVMKI